VRRVCAWCGVELGSGGKSRGGVITHGICEACRQRFFSAPIQHGLQELLDRLPVPVLVVDQDVRVRGANRAAREVLGKSLDDVRGRLGGEAIECVHAGEPGGCGRSLHCKGCVIRSMVTDTFVNGTDHDQVPTTQEVVPAQASQPVQLSVSTEKFGGLVLLRIERRGTRAA
jgi:PAS domain-containing protein